MMMMMMMIIEDEIKRIRTRFEKLAWTLDERMRRLFAAAEASALGHGGITKVAQATGYHDARFTSDCESWQRGKCLLNIKTSAFAKRERAENLSSRPILA